MITNHQSSFARLWRNYHHGVISMIEDGTNQALHAYGAITNYHHGVISMIEDGTNLTPARDAFCLPRST